MFTFTSKIRRCNFTFGTYLWNPRYKGLDDYLWEGKLKKVRAEGAWSNRPGSFLLLLSIKIIDIIFEMPYNNYATLFLSFRRNVTLTIG